MKVCKTCDNEASCLSCYEDSNRDGRLCKCIDKFYEFNETCLCNNYKKKFI